MQACRGWSLQGSTAVRGSAAAASLRQQGTELAEETLHSTYVMHVQGAWQLVVAESTLCCRAAQQRSGSSAMQLLSSTNRALRWLSRASFAQHLHDACARCLAVECSRINPALQGSTTEEWKQCHAAAQLNKRGSEMAEQMQRSTCMLVMEYVPGRALFNIDQPFMPDNLEQTAADLGR